MPDDDQEFKQKRFNFTVGILGPFSPKAVVALDNSSSNLYFSTWSEASPVNAQISNLLRHVHSIVAITFSQNAQVVQISQYHNVTFVVIPRRKIKYCVLDNYKKERFLGKKLINELAVTIIHAHWTYEYALLGLDCNADSIITVHDNPLRVFKFFRDKFRFYKLIQAILVRCRSRSSNLVFVSNAIAISWRKNMLYFQKANVIPNINRIIPTKSAKNESNLILLAMGNSSRLKNIETLLVAFQLIIKKFPYSILHLCGDGLDYGSSLEQRWGGKFGQNVRWHGQVELKKLQSILLESSIYIHPSLEETQGMAVVEAMSFGKPVIVHDQIPALRETCGDIAFYADCSSAENLYNVVCTLLESDLDFEHLAEQSINHVKRKFNTELTTKKLLDLYSDRISIKNV